ncbi:MAG: molybdate ABC transporter substrate-binding protein [Thermanaerothrix sp.]|nr:molybdate ABC transporter substrate-binding protein [Thermanaerothrix sp.]
MARGLGRFLSLLLCSAWVLGISPAVSFGEARELSVAVVFGFKPPMEKILGQYKAGGVRLSVSYGTSGELARQVTLGAPYRVFICSDQRWADMLKSKGLVKRSFELASNPVVLWSPSDSPLEIKDLGKFKLAIPDPVTAAYGMKAKEYLEKAGLWESMASKGMLIIGGGPQRAALVAKTGMAKGAVIGRSVAMDMKEGSFVELPVKAPVFTVLVLKGASREDEDFAEYFKTQDSVRRILEGSGFKPLR